MQLLECPIQRLSGATAGAGSSRSCASRGRCDGASRRSGSGLPWVRWTPPSNTPEAGDRADVQLIRVTHPFHPLAGRDLEFVKRRKNWQADRVYVFDPAGKLVSLPAEWTDAVTPDPFVVMSAGRSPFHVSSLVALADLVLQLTSDRSQSVKRTSP